MRRWRESLRWLRVWGERGRTRDGTRRRRQGLRDQAARTHAHAISRERQKEKEKESEQHTKDEGKKSIFDPSKHTTLTQAEPPPDGPVSVRGDRQTGTGSARPAGAPDVSARCAQRLPPVHKSQLRTSISTQGQVFGSCDKNRARASKKTTATHKENVTEADSRRTAAGSWTRRSHKASSRRHVDRQQSTWQDLFKWQVFEQHFHIRDGFAQCHGCDSGGQLAARCVGIDVSLVHGAQRLPIYKRM